MRFVHLADCHIGAWREPKLTELNSHAFSAAIAFCLSERVDFVLISGDLFNSSLPALDNLKLVVGELKKLADAGIAVYAIAGSHDYSPSGRTIIDVLEKGGLLTNVTKGTVANGRLRLRFTVDRATGAKIAGIPGKKGMLERSWYDGLDKEVLESGSGFKIFMLHSPLEELHPGMGGLPLSALPTGFDYYAGGHVHARAELSLPNKGLVAFPGPLFPNSFSELERFGHGGFYIWEDGCASWKPIKLRQVYAIKLDASGKTGLELERELNLHLERAGLAGSIVTLRLFGRMAGRPAELEFGRAIAQCYAKGAWLVLKQTAGLFGEGVALKRPEQALEVTEEEVIREGAKKLGCEPGLLKELMAALDKARAEDERVAAYEERLFQAVTKLLELD